MRREERSDVGPRARKLRAAAALAIVSPAPSIGVTLALWIAPGPVGSAAYALGKLVLYGVPSAWHVLVDRRPPSWSPPRRGGLGAGLLLGVGISAVILAAWALVGRHVIDPAPLRELAIEGGFASPARYLGFALWLTLVNSALEEHAFRWFVFTRWRTLVGRGAAILLTGLVFTAHHVIALKAFFSWPVTLACSAGVLAGGVLWSWCYERWASIWPGWLSHVVVDAAVLGLGAVLLFEV